MEIVKIGKKTWCIGVVCQIRQSFYTAKLFYCVVYLFYVKWLLTNLFSFNFEAKYNDI